jgi:TM2 domain-containing membrane protein YozV
MSQWQPPYDPRQQRPVTPPQWQASAPPASVPHPAPVPYGYAPPYRPPYAPAVAPKSTGTGLLLGLLFPGVGCMYAGRVGSGIAILTAWVLSIPLVFAFGIGILTGLAAWIMSAVFGYTMTRDWNAERGIES